MSIDKALIAKPRDAFTFPDEQSFCVAGVNFRIDEDDDRSMFGPNVRLWADGVMIFQDRKITVLGGMGTQVHNSYSTIVALRDRVGRFRKEQQSDLQASKLAEVSALLSRATA